MTKLPNWLPLSVLLILLASAATVPAQDLRDRFGTRSLEAAQQLEQGIRLAQQRKPKDALPHIEAAVKADPDLQLALYWKAAVLTDLAQVDEALSAYEALVALGERTRINNVTVDGCINLALTYARLNEEKKASHWFTKALLLDPGDKHKLHWKAYRNMAISLATRGDYDSAAMCAIHGYLADDRRVEFGMVLQFLERSDDAEEVVKVLHFQDQTPTVESREETASLTEIKNDFAFPATVSDLMPDAKSGSVIAICKGQRQWYSISADGGRSIEHQAAAPITCATLIDGQLYLCLESPSRLQKIAIQTGKVEKEWNLKSSRPSSVAVVPVQDVAFVSDRKMLHKVDLLSGSITNTDYYCDLVTSDPLQKFCYTQVRDEGESGHMFVDGRAIRFSIRDRWTQTALYQHAVADRDVLLSAMRMNASSNGRRLYVSPDGHWVASVGGGGWRPTSSSAGEGSGYGIAVFRAADFSRVQGFYETDAYPLGVAINPVTRQLVAVRAKDAKIHQLSKAKDAVTVAGAFTGAAAWSSDGGTLFLASGKKLRVWQNSLSTSEQQLARAWLANLSQRMARRKTKTERAIGVVAVKEMATFALKKTKSDVQSMLKKAGSVSGEIKPMEWLQHEPYQSDPQLKQFFAQASRSVQNPRDIGILIYRLRSMKKKHPEHPGFDFLLGIATFTAGDFEKCIEHQLEAIHTDQGKTNITIEALRCLAHGHKREKQPLTAAYCMATVLRLDPTNPRWQKEATPFFEATGLMAEAKPVLDGRTAASSSPAVTVAVNLNLPELGSPKSRRKYDGRRLFQKVAPSTVVIKTEGGSGSGVCVGRPGIILTNQHVVRGVDGKVDVHPFAIRSGRLVRLSALKADVVYQSVRDDIAILQIAKAPRTLLPLEVSTSEPDSGTRIYAVGSPGLGSRILDQTISEGIVSSPSRELDGQSFIQHTAAVNPGNSGGPVLNELGHVVGIVTLKARLENVSFAIPATTVRKTFETLRKK